MGFRLEVFAALCALAAATAAPTSAANWTAAGPLTSARVFSIAADPADPNVVYAGGVGRIYKSTNQGATYTTHFLPIVRYSQVIKIEVNPKNNNELYFVSGNSENNPWLVPHYLFHSMDAGNTITFVRSLPVKSRAFTVDWNEPRKLYVDGGPSYKNAFVSSDDGASWKQLTVPIGYSGALRPDVVVDPIDSRNIYFMTAGSYVVSTHDGGATFSTSSSAGTWGAMTSLAMSPLNSKHLAVGMLNFTLPSPVYVTTDGFKTNFAAFNAGTTDKISALGYDYRSPERLFAGAIGNELDSIGLNVVLEQPLGRTDAIKYSDDLLNQKWVSAKTDRPVGHVTQFSSSPSVSGLVFAATDGTGILKSTDRGVSWKKQDSGVAGASVSGISSSKATGNVYLATLGDGTKKSTTGGASWAALGRLSGQSFVLSIDFDNHSNILYAGTQTGIFASTEGSSMWRKISAPDATEYPVKSIIVSPFDGNILYVKKIHYNNITPTDSIIANFYTTDLGANWKPFGTWNGNPVDGATYVSRFKKGIVFDSNGYGTLRSTNNGQTWSRVDAGAIYDMVSAPSAPSIMYGCRPDGSVTMSINGGAAWTARKNPRNPSGSMACLVDDFGPDGRPRLAVHPTNSAHVYGVFWNIGGMGLYESTDRGLTWSEIKTGIPYFPNGYPSDITGLYPAGDRLFLATRGLGAWWTKW